MNVALALAGLAMGVASSPHCVLMCGAPCAAIVGDRRSASIGFHAGRLAGYMAMGGLAAASVSALGTWTRTMPALQPLWLLVHLGFLLLGLWWLLTGAMPARLLRDGNVPVRFVHRRTHVARATGAGLAWVAWPCGALQGALLVSALANGAVAGAVVMGGFALGSLPALGSAPWLWQRLRAAMGGRLDGKGVAAIGYRVAGLTLVLSSGWAMAHEVRERLAAFCAT